MERYNYLLQYLDLTYYSNTYDLDRQYLHSNIIDSYFANIEQKISRKNNKNTREFIFTSGCYGCGKSHILKLLDKMQKINLNQYVFVDPDKLRTRIPEYEKLLEQNPWIAGYKTNQEVLYISELIRLHAMFMGYNVIYDSSLRDAEWTTSHFEWIRQNFPNTRIKIIHVQADWVNVLERNILRAEQTKRCIPLENIRSVYFQSIKSNEILSQIADSHINIPNNNDDEAQEYISNYFSNF